MKSVFGLCLAAGILWGGISLGGCNSAPEIDNTPTKAAIDKQLEGRPAIDPKDSAPMR